MELDDLILVSVDDHVVEPPDLFERHLPEKWRDVAPRIIQRDDGTDVWLYQGMELPNIGLNAVAGRPPDEYGLEPTSFGYVTRSEIAPQRDAGRSGGSPRTEYVRAQRQLPLSLACRLRESLRVRRRI